MSIGSLFSEGFLLILVGRNACELLENHGEIATASEANVYGYGLYGYVGIFRRDRRRHASSMRYCDRRVLKLMPNTSFMTREAVRVCIPSMAAIFSSEKSC